MPIIIEKQHQSAFARNFSNSKDLTSEAERPNSWPYFGNFISIFSAFLIRKLSVVSELLSKLELRFHGGLVCFGD